MMESNAISLWQTDYPSSLYPHEYADPIGVIKQVFDQYTLKQIQIALWNWLPFQMTDEIKPTADQRFFLFRLGNQLDRLVDAAWVLVNQYQEITYHADPNLKNLINSDTLSFLSLEEARNPIKTMRKLFKGSKLHRWKTIAIYDRQLALLDPFFWMHGNSMYLREFGEYVNLNSLAEAAYQLAGSMDNLNADYHWSIETTGIDDPINWGVGYFKTKEIKDVLNSLAFLYHIKRWSQEWHPSAAFQLMQHYGDLYRLIHLAHYLANNVNIPSPDDSSERIIEALKKKFRKFSIGKTARFLTDCISLSWTFREVSERLKPDENELKHVENIIHLTTNYFTYYKKT
ncbi:hypothetical protein [Olivibacter sp. XZL3]|uniref:hypothetical protein n=1 Tax=Olivibacter sp. XZL3 TaxID=1735116 RepID=UPI001065D6F3|nr:hypothetical protein [Olivibacter sp. XZL3]